MIRAAGYVVVEMWECTFKKELKQNEELQDLVKNMTWVSPLDPRVVWWTIWYGQMLSHCRGRRTNFFIKISQACNQRSISMVLTPWVIHRSLSSQRVKTSKITLELPR